MAPNDSTVKRGSRSSDPRVSPAWLKLVDKELVNRGWTRRKLALHVEVDESNISRLFKRKAGEQTIRKVASVLGLPDPLVIPIDADDDWAQWIAISERMRTADPERFRLLLRCVRSWDENEKNWEVIAKLIGR